MIIILSIVHQHMYQNSCVRQSQGPLPGANTGYLPPCHKGFLLSQSTPRSWAVTQVPCNSQPPHRCRKLITRVFHSSFIFVTVLLTWPSLMVLFLAYTAKPWWSFSCFHGQAWWSFFLFTWLSLMVLFLVYMAKLWWSFFLFTWLSLMVLFLVYMAKPDGPFSCLHG